MGARTVCSNCQTPYSDKKPGELCPKCGGTLIRRRDDDPIAVQNRLDVYAQQTAPVFNWYKKSGAKVVSVDAVGSVEDVTKRALQGLGK
jgi:adenylate kinase